MEFFQLNTGMRVQAWSPLGRGALTQDDFHELSCLPNIRWGGEHPDIAIPQVESNFNQ